MTLVVDDSSPRPAQTVIAWILTVVTIGYFLPWAIAATRGKSNTAVVGWLNFLLGWTFIGWVVALVMALTAHGIVGVRHYPPAYPPRR
jgi:succinate dehydrogenase/fumarate reductase cytochrome b subunit